MASASGPAGRPAPSTTRGRRGLSSSDSAAGEYCDSHTLTATTTAVKPPTATTVTTVLAADDSASALVTVAVTTPLASRPGPGCRNP